MIARKYVVIGRVQGVGFRWFVMHQARRLRLSGRVRNCRDGSVEVLAEGSILDLEALEAALRAGPPGAMVREVRSENLETAGKWDGFEIDV